MYFSNVELMCLVEDQLKVGFKGAEDVEVLNFTDNKIYFNLKTNGVWVDGYVKVDPNTDLGVYVQWDPYLAHFTYQFDILWDDILSEEAE